MRRTSWMLLSVLLLCGIPAMANTEILTLNSNSSADDPVFSIIEERNEKLTLEFQISSLQVDEIAVDRELFHSLTIPGCQLQGVDGQAGLPCITRLIAVPDGASVNINLLSKEEKSFSGYRVFPIQPDEAEEFTIDRAYYSGSDRTEKEAVVLGKAGILRDLRVIPITFSPVTYDPVSGDIQVAERMTVEIDFSGRDVRAETPRKRNLIPESFDNMYKDTVINYRSEDVNVGPGTYLMVCYNSSSVTSRVQSLLDWRRRQGYNVILETTTSSSTGTIKSIIQGHYNTANPPLEFVTLVGDANGDYPIPTYFENQSGYSGEGDHVYSMLEGSDSLADVHIGRISIRDSGELDVVIDKIVNYETDPPLSDSGWFTRATLAGDPSASGISCIMVNQWLKRQLLNMGYSDVDTIWSGSFTSSVPNSINQGVSVFAYRGYYNMSNITSQLLSYLSNGGELAFAVIPTCDTGSFAADNACRSEAIFRCSGGGAIASIGTATIGTHTRYNNCFFLGTWEGAINGSDHRVGVAQSRGKLEIYNNYSNYEDHIVDIWSAWNTLIGDPATNMWTRYPHDFTVTYPSTLPADAISVPVLVRRGSSPVRDALVAVYKSGEVSETAYTDSQGKVNIPISGVSSGTLLVTATKDSYIPYRGSLSLGSVSNYPAFSQATIDDDNSGGSQGNDDGVINSGETIEMSVALRNFGTSSVSNVSATLETSDSYVTIIDGSETYGTIGAGATDWCGEDFDFTVAGDTPDGHIIKFNLIATNGSTEWSSAIELTVASAAFDYSSFSWGGSGSTLDPGESGSFSITVRNNGSAAASGATGTLTTTSDWVSITDSSGSYGDIGTGSTASGGFGLSIATECFQGHMATFELTIAYDSGAQDIVEFLVPVGSASSDDPVGPDTYGYYAFDNTDSAYPLRPIYNWIEIAPNHGGSGVDAGLNDTYYEGDDITTVTLPFPFTFYGQTYNELSICSNGFVAFGDTPVRSYRNWSIPSAGNPNGLISVFWDNLQEYGDDQVYTYEDTDNHQFIIQWSRMRNFIDDSSHSVQNVQLILKDPNEHVTATGDGIIVMQYETVNNTDYRDGYATVGIQNPKDFSGLLYTYANNYAPGAATLTGGRAIAFMPVGEMHLGTLQGEVTDSNSGAGLVGVPVRVVEASQTIISGENGLYSGGVGEGLYTLQVNHESFELETVNDVQIIEDQVTTVDIQLTDILGPYISETTVLPTTGNTTDPFVVDTWITDFTSLEELSLNYKRNNGGVNTVALTVVDLDTGHYRGEIPAMPASSHIEYWITAEDASGNSSRDPEVGTEYYDFWVLNVVVDFDDDMETNQGWTVNAAGTDDATSGVWVRVEPFGVWQGGAEVCPENDASDDGTLCWVTGNSESGNQGADDVDGGTTTLYSPVFDLQNAYTAALSYRRWYTNSTGNSPNNDYWTVLITDDGTNWVELENTTASDRSWSLHEFDLNGIIDFTSNVQVAFVASDLGEGSIVEGGVDEFLLKAFEEPEVTATPEGPAPAKLTLMQNMPNPFNPETKISFGLPYSQKVALKIYDPSGRLVKTLLNDHPLGEGFHSVEWNGRDDRDIQVSSGIYFYVLSSESQKLTAKMTLLK
ncbi:MAG: T9SS type A sorting domain-containing protein [bacterium]|nr:T9SS type A sorting domain-containing protein [bacterium]